MASRGLGQDSLVGQLGHYHIAEKIGAGGMGEVYRAHDEHLARDVAIKVLPSSVLTDESARKHFHKEALVLSKLNHPNIATIYDFDTQQGMDFLVMEYIPGTTLSEKLKARPLPEKQVIALGTQLAEGLSAAHEHGVIHRDLKPGNLQLTDDGRLKILDFGLAKLRLPVTAGAATESLSEKQTISGTLPYMAPEQLLGEESDARTDIHAAGCVLYEMATGQRPFAGGEPPQLIGAILHRPPQPPTTLNPRLSPELERIIGKCLEKEPENRYQSAKELAIDLRRLVAPSTAAMPVRKRERRTRRPILVAVALLVAVIVAVFTLNVGGWRDRILGNATPPRIRSLAVLPLENLTGDPGQEYFADGMTEELIATLSKISSLRVISRTSAMRYKTTSKALPEIARELNVDSVIEGSVMRSGNRVRITAQLIRAADDRDLWAESYERDMGDVLGLQSDIAEAVADEIRLRLTPEERRTLSTRRTVRPDVQDAYLRGRYYWNQRTAESLNKAVQYFEEVAAKDPKWALGYAGLADCYNLLPYYANLPPQDFLRKAKDAARKALAIDEALAEAHTSLSFALMYGDWDLPGAEDELKRSLALNPNYSTAHLWYAGLLARTGQLQEALVEIRRAEQLDPVSPFIVSQVGFILYYLREYDSALSQLQKALALDPNYWVTRMDLGFVYEQQGQFQKALPEFQKSVALSGHSAATIAALGHAYAMSGDRQRALQQVAELERQARQGYVSPYYLAVVYAGLNDKGTAFGELEKAYKNHDDLFDLKIDPWFDSLRSDPRFKTLLRRLPS